MSRPAAGEPAMAPAMPGGASNAAPDVGPVPSHQQGTDWPVTVPRPAARRRRTGRGRRLAPRPPGTSRFLVLACGPEDTAAVELGTGALTRLRIDWGDRQPNLPPFSVIDVPLSGQVDTEDLAQPEAVTAAAVPELAGELRRRPLRRLLRHLVAPAEPHLLGFPGVSQPYWEFRGMRPSLALVVPTRGPLVFLRRSDGSTWVRFGWPRSDNWLPVEDRRVVAALWAARRDRLSGKDLAGALGFRPHYLLVALSAPRGGHCYKTVVAFLPRPS